MSNKGRIVERFTKANELPASHAGLPFASHVLKQIEELLPSRFEASAETGCGKSTILFSNLSEHHTVFCLDDRALGDDSSVNYVDRSSYTRRDRVHYVFGPTQLTIPIYKDHGTYDVVLIDGPHGYPFPEIEYCYLYPHIKAGGILILDDVNIPTIGRLADFIYEDEMFEFFALVESTALFRRTAAPLFDPCGDGWWEQRFNRRRISQVRSNYLGDRLPVDTFSTMRIDDRVHRLLPPGGLAIVEFDQSGSIHPTRQTEVSRRFESQLDEKLSEDWCRLLSDQSAQLPVSLSATCILSRTLVAVDVPVALVDRFFRFRLIQLLEDLHRLDVTLILAFRPGDSISAPGQFAIRARTSWPFQKTYFVCADAASAENYSAQLGVTVHAVSDSDVAELVGKVVSGEDAGVLAYEASPTADQTISVQMQPSWGRCGSSTAFENEIEALVARGDFVVHVFVPDAGANPGDEELYARVEQSRRETSVHVGAHVACAVGREPHSEGFSPVATTLGLEFEAEVLGRQQFQPRDQLVGAILKLATVAVVNHVVNVPLAITLCPNARIVLDMHDCFTRNAFARDKLGVSTKAFASHRELRDMLRSEIAIWRLADACTAVNRKELAQLQRWNKAASIVLPKPYVRRIAAPRQEDCQFQVLLVADQHPFNIRALSWFLDDVWRPHAELRRLRLAVAGRASNYIDAARYGDCNVHFFGFVDDLEALRARCLMSVAPDLDGTGVAVKVLTALAAGHPLVATPIALRGFDPAIGLGFPTFSAPDDLAADIVGLAGDPGRRAARITAGDMLFAKLIGDGFGGVLAQLAKSDRQASTDKEDAMQSLLSQLKQRNIRSRIVAESSRLAELRQAVRLVASQFGMNA